VSFSKNWHETGYCRERIYDDGKISSIFSSFRDGRIVFSLTHFYHAHQAVMNISQRILFAAA
jgi:hypothetical protein